ncbi:MAG: DUF6325 family protein [Methanomassiliicoccus sp.]|nr:DUF6325 family protein [Methanomassiliicoccus sp.]
MLGSLGPIDYIVVLFPSATHTGSIAKELSDLEGSEVIKVIDLVFVTKDREGMLTTKSSEDLADDEGKGFERFSHGLQGWLSLDEVAAIGEMLPVDSSAAVMLVENTWIDRLRKAAADDRARVITEGRMPHRSVL